MSVQKVQKGGFAKAPIYAGNSADQVLTHSPLSIDLITFIDPMTSSKSCIIDARAEA